MKERVRDRGKRNREGEKRGGGEGAEIDERKNL